ncbi:hypothetical protein [Nocardiopsis sp. FIRDI 009]|uniref:hypothetical protein n=1 Tax=Nocardiopsis sp. FIRDI 009 TaxID=714197 RepID=UPI0018E577F5|nr:hypothetical protein [Nocardiopsis sp. FIRDI 009]
MSITLTPPGCSEIEHQEVTMSMPLTDIDDGALAKAAAILGTSTLEEKVNAALREAAECARRLSALRAGAHRVSPGTPPGGDPREGREP